MHHFIKSCLQNSSLSQHSIHLISQYTNLKHPLSLIFSKSRFQVCLNIGFRPVQMCKPLACKSKTFSFITLCKDGKRIELFI
jgi:hypothetical protein